MDPQYGRQIGENITRGLELLDRIIAGDTIMHRTAFIWQQIDARLPDNPEGLDLRDRIRAATAGITVTEEVYIPLSPTDLRILQDLGLV